MERRRSRRFGLAVPMDADIRVLQDVQIEHAEDNAVTVLSDSPGIRGEELTLRVAPEDDGQVPLTVAVRTTSSEPRLVDGRLVHRVHLTMTGAAALRHGEHGAPSPWPALERTSTVVIRHHTARIVNLSRGGCLFELSTRLPVGTVATLHRAETSGSPEAIRVNSLHERKGGSWPYAAGAEFLSIEPPGHHSLRALASHMESEEEGLRGLSDGREARSAPVQPPPHAPGAGSPGTKWRN